MRHAEQTVPASRTGAGFGEGTFPCCSAFHIPRSAFWGGAVTVWAWDSVSVTLGVSGPRGLRFTGVSTDTRHLTPGALFVALKGERFDAHDFLPDAKGRGAAAAVVRRGTPPVDGLPFFEVPDTLEALGMLARARRRLLPSQSPVIAITGSSGKTSTKEMIRAALGTKWRGDATSPHPTNPLRVPPPPPPAPPDAAAGPGGAGGSGPGARTPPPHHNQ